ncbi:unnamed protein product [Staurois parvus]|uniref:Uncharacterized protein n=1 Tax=Staurois parvus TaxID=386267 RepID=A0ABN9F557_9NEOB|nr:unnamed protein product [Staurois parvus]
MQVPVLGCTFLTLSDREESTAENRQLSEQGSAPIIRALMISALMIGAQQCPAVPPASSAHLCPAVSPTCAQQCTHLCHSAVSHTCAQKCHPPVPSSATHLCPPVPPTCAHPPVLPTSATHQCSPAVLPVSATSQCTGVVPVSAQQ